MASDSDEKSMKKKRSFNTGAVEFMEDPPGIFEAKDPRKRKGIRRIPYRSGHEPTLHQFIQLPALKIQQARRNGNPDAQWWGATNTDKPSDMFLRRIHWESFAPRYTMQQGDTKSGAPRLPLPMIDFWYEKQMYGKVDLKQNPIYISETYFQSLIEGNGTHQAPAFVAKAFRDLTKAWVQFYERTSTGDRSPEEARCYPGGKYAPIAGGIHVHKAWESIHPQYQAHMEKVFESFQQWTLQDGRRQKILTFKDFMRNMIYFIDVITPQIPITRSGFILSRDCSRSISGWQIDLWDEDFGNDVVKKESYLNDPNFELFVAFASKYGFVIDFNAPWRLVADVHSTAMRTYIRDFAAEGKDHRGKGTSITELTRRRDRWHATATGVQTIPGERDRAYKMAHRYDELIKKWQTRNLDIMFRKCYYRADSTDLKVLMNYFCSMWNSFAQAFPTQADQVWFKGEIIQVTKRREPIKFDGRQTPQDMLYSSIRRRNHAMLLGKADTRMSQPGMAPSSYEVFSDTLGATFAARFYFWIRAREAAVDWTQRIFDQNVKILAELQKTLDGNRALDYINNKTRRLAAPGGNPPFRTVLDKSKAFRRHEARERSSAGRGQFIIYI